MIQQLKNLNRWNLTVLLAVMSVFSLALSITRCLITGSSTFLFLNWNLFLAFIPWLISSIILIYGLYKKYILALLIMAWLLFFPNSPYILTDLFHLRVIDSAPIWFDLILILSFAWTGLLFGFISLMDIEQLLSKHFHQRSISLVSVMFLFTSGFGIYIGRFLRWNSWDVVGNPTGLFADIAERFIHPFAHGRTWGLTILTGILLNMMYFSLKLLNQKKTGSVI